MNRPPLHRALLIALLMPALSFAQESDLQQTATADVATATPPATVAPDQQPAPSTNAEEQSVVTEPVADAAESSSGAESEQDAADADFALLYGDGAAAAQDGSYNPIGDPTLPNAAQVGEIWDPWERYNRQVHKFNKAVDDKLAKPLARGYVEHVPRLVRLGVNNFFNNLRLPVSAVNSLLQGKPNNAARNLARFAVNSTLGLGGVVDAAADANLNERAEDFGQTMGTWGWQRSRYIELPFFGPRTLRDTVGMFVDAPISPVRHVADQNVRLGLQGLSLVDVRAELLTLDGLTEGIEDDYLLLRDTWSRRRMYQINSDRRRAKDEPQLPDYLDDDRNPQAPADAIPVIPRT